MSWSWLAISGLVTRNALQRPATRLYPFERRTPYPHARGHIRFTVTDCTFCTTCAVKCPTAAIVVDKKGKTWAIDHRLCILCGNCVSSCRESCLTQSDVPYPPLTAAEVAQFQQQYGSPIAG